MNGYLGWKLPQQIKEDIDPKSGWPNLIVAPSPGGWPNLTEEEKKTLDELADSRGGHPDFQFEYMDFSEHLFSKEVNFSSLIFVCSNFSKVKFDKIVVV